MAEKNKTTKLKEERDRKRQERAARVQRAIDLYRQGVIKTRIAEDLGVSFDSVCRWLKNVSPTDQETQTDDTRDAFTKNLDSVVDQTVTDSKLAARELEEQALMEVAENQAAPADKYQAYVAATAIKMLRDNFRNIRGPRTVRELSELDQLIRRNLGLNPKGGSGGSNSLTIDVSILSNAKSTNGGSESVVVDADLVEKN